MKKKTVNESAELVPSKGPKTSIGTLLLNEFITKNPDIRDKGTLNAAWKKFEGNAAKLINQEILKIVPRANLIGITATLSKRTWVQDSDAENIFTLYNSLSIIVLLNPDIEGETYAGDLEGWQNDPIFKDETLIYGKKDSNNAVEIIDNFVVSVDTEFNKGGIKEYTELTAVKVKHNVFERFTKPGVKLSDLKESFIRRKLDEGSAVLLKSINTGDTKIIKRKQA